MENFVHILTHNGVKIAFKTKNQLIEYIDQNKMRKVHITSIQYYKDNTSEKGDTE